MAVPALVTTPGAADANAYVSLAEAEAYCEQHVAGAGWLAEADDDKKAAAILQATRELDAYVQWSGSPTYSSTQALAWPRLGLYYPAGLADPNTWRAVDANEIPVRLKRACAEQARVLLAGGDRAAELDQQVQGITKMDVGGAVAIEFGGATGALPRQVLAPAAWAYVACWGVMRQPGRGGAVPLVRM
jgi:hypothetical protein